VRAASCWCRQNAFVSPNHHMTATRPHSPHWAARELGDPHMYATAPPGQRCESHTASALAVPSSAAQPTQQGITIRCWPARLMQSICSQLCVVCNTAPCAHSLCVPASPAQMTPMPGIRQSSATHRTRVRSRGLRARSRSR